MALAIRSTELATSSLGAVDYKSRRRWLARQAETIPVCGPRQKGTRTKVLPGTEGVEAVATGITGLVLASTRDIFGTLERASPLSGTGVESLQLCAEPAE